MTTISTHCSHLTKPYFSKLFKPHLNHPGKCQVTQGGNLYKIGSNKFMCDGGVCGRGVVGQGVREGVFVGE